VNRICLRPAHDQPHLAAIYLERGESKTIGRSPQADLVVDEASLSRLHARLTFTSDGKTVVEDLGSTNGVLVNNSRQDAATLTMGDRVRLGTVEYFVDAAAESPLDTEGTTIMRVPLAGDTAAVVTDAVALAGLLATSRELMAFGDLPGLLQHVLDRLQPILNPDRSAILLFDGATEELTPRAVQPPGAYTSVSDFASATAVRQAIKAREVLEVTDARMDERLNASESIVRAGVRSAVVVPMLGRTGPVGALYADRVSWSGTFTPAQVQYAAAFAAHAASALETAQLYEDRERLFRQTLEAFAKAIDARDRYTAGHSERVTAYTLVIAQAAGLTPASLETIRRAGPLHDIGKVGIPDQILLKAGPLDPAERLIMESHVTIGFDMLLSLQFLRDALPVIRGHHERWDGRGYPDRLAGRSINQMSRLMSVADSYDAMTSARPYRTALSCAEAARRLRADSGKQFDPEAVEAFDAVETQFSDIRVQMAPAQTAEGSCRPA
jgi:HD-GYP domain-containing protein (c-di-GMP phosphodiesterase class II)